MATSDLAGVWACQRTPPRAWVDLARGIAQVNRADRRSPTSVTGSPARGDSPVVPVDRCSMSTTSIPRLLSSHANISPVGPAPTMATSAVRLAHYFHRYLFTMHRCLCKCNWRFRPLRTACTALPGGRQARDTNSPPRACRDDCGDKVDRQLFKEDRDPPAPQPRATGECRRADLLPCGRRRSATAGPPPRPTCPCWPSSATVVNTPRPPWPPLPGSSSHPWRSCWRGWIATV